MMDGKNMGNVIDFKRIRRAKEIEEISKMIESGRAYFPLGIKSLKELNGWRENERD